MQTNMPAGARCINMGIISTNRKLTPPPFHSDLVPRSRSKAITYSYADKIFQISLCSGFRKFIIVIDCIECSIVSTYTNELLRTLECLKKANLFCTLQKASSKTHYVGDILKDVSLG